MGMRGEKSHREILRELARRAMEERGLDPDFPAPVLAELASIPGPAPVGGLRDLRDLPWCSIDNADSMDLDQLSCAESRPDGACLVRVAIADVDALVPRGGRLDERALLATATLYTPAEIFPMIPAALSEDLCSLAASRDRGSLVVELLIAGDGAIRGSTIDRAAVRNRAKLSYDSVGPWLEGREGAPAALQALPGLAESLRLQDAAARALRALRFAQGALDFESIETRPVLEGENLKELRPEGRNRAKELISELMIAVNGEVARFLDGQGFPAIARTVKEPARWDRIIELAAQRGAALPAAPDSASLEAFLLAEKLKDRVGFPDLSMSVIKLMGAGEYAVKAPGEAGAGHFALAAKAYAHSTAPNRRFSDLLSQRLLKAAIAGSAPPYSVPELGEIARRCTEGEAAIKKVERRIGKAATALLLEGRIGEGFDAIVTGAASKGTWVRILAPHAEGRLVGGFEGLDVGDRLRAVLVAVDPERGFIDFERGE